MGRVIPVSRERPFDRPSPVGDSSPALIAHMLGEFLVGTQSVLLGGVLAPKELPVPLRTLLHEAVAIGKIGAAWFTNRGPMAAWADYDRDQSVRVRAHVLLIDWCQLPDVHHNGWWHCNRRTEGGAVDLRHSRSPCASSRFRGEARAAAGDPRSGELSRRAPRIKPVARPLIAQRHFVLGVVTQALYVGAQVGIGAFS